MNWKRRAVMYGTVVSLVLGGSSPAWAGSPVPPGQADLTALGGSLYASYVSQSAALVSEVWYFGSLNQGPTNTPDITNAVFLFANNGARYSAYNGAQALAFAPPPIPGVQVTIPGTSTLTAGTTLVFGLYVPGLTSPNAPNGRWFFTGAGNYNVDDNIHAKLTIVNPTTVEVGFEDLCNTGQPLNICAADNPNWVNDWDYNDHVFNLAGATTTPEPLSMTLFGTGLAGLGLLRRFRRKQHQA